MQKISLFLFASVTLVVANSESLAEGVIGGVVNRATGGVVNLDNGGAVINPPDPKTILNPIPDKIPGTDISTPKVPLLVPKEIQKPAAAVLPYIAPGTEAVAIPHELTPQGSVERAERILDATADAITFGQHGRDRDKERAKQEEQLADARRKGIEDTKTATLNGLQGQLELVKQSVEQWQRFNNKLPTVLEYQKRLITFATDVLAHNIDVQATLKSMGEGLQDTKGSLAVLVGAMRAAPQTSDRFADAEVWDFGVTTMVKQMKNSNEEVEHYLNRAILQSDPKELGDFIDAVSKSRNRVEQLVDEAKHNLEAESANKASLEKQIATLH